MKQRGRRPGIRYWFPARDQGWGWKWPHTWQGWLVVDAYFCGMIISLFVTIFGGQRNILYGIFGLLVLNGGLMTAVYLKGEPRHFR